MPNYVVEVPVVLKLTVGVEAESKEDAVDKVFNGDITIDVNDENKAFGFIDYEWEMHEKVTQGNVYYGGINKVNVYEEED